MRAAAILVALLAPMAMAGHARAQAPIKVGKDRIVDTVHTYQPGIDVAHYEFALDIPEDGAPIAARATISLRRTAPVPALRLDLVRLRVDSVQVDGRRVRFERDSATLRVPLPDADSTDVTVYYGGTPRDGLIIRRDSAGRRTLFGDNWPDRARQWLPTVDHPSDKATVRWSIRAPAWMTVVANGAGTREGGRHVWNESRPIPTYLMVVAAARLDSMSLGETACGFGDFARCVPQVLYTFPGQAPAIPGPFARAGDIVAFFARTVGIFPYEKLAHLQSSTRFGGMENASAIFYSEEVIRRGATRVGLIAHEAAHQWFGDAVTGREWAHLWLSEGFATYFEQLWTEHDLGRDSLREGMRRIRERILTAPEVAARPVIDTAPRELTALLNVNSYQKGGFVLHMLRTLVGDSVFFRGIRSYYAAHRHGTAVTDDLRREMEHASGRPLRWFFDQWLRRPGFATVDARWVYDPARRAIAFKAVQSGKHGLYRLTLPIEIDDGTTVHRLVLDIPAKQETRLWLPLEVPRKPARVTLDPDAEVLAVLTSFGG